MEMFEKTWGKCYELPNNTAFRVSTGKYFTLPIGDMNSPSYNKLIEGYPLLMTRNFVFGFKKISSLLRC